MKSSKKNLGFTLIELLVVISIIGLLSVIVLASLNTARAKGRDAGRIATMIQLRNALELYRTTYGQYPTYYPVGTVGPGWLGEYFGMNNGSFVTQGASNGSTLLPGLIPTYIRSFPTNPPNPNNYIFLYYSDGNDYMFEAYEYLETPLSTNSPFYSSNTDKYSPFIYSRKSFIDDAGYYF